MLRRRRLGRDTRPHCKVGTYRDGSWEARSPRRCRTPTRTSAATISRTTAGPCSSAVSTARRAKCAGPTSRAPRRRRRGPPGGGARRAPWMSASFRNSLARTRRRGAACSRPGVSFSFAFADSRERRRYSRDENQMAEEERYRFVDLTGVVDESKAPRADNGRYRFDASVSWLALRLIQRRLSARSYASPALLVPLGTFLGLG